MTKMNPLRIALFATIAFLSGCADDHAHSKPRANITANVDEVGIGPSFVKPLLKMLQETASSSGKPVSVSFDRDNTSIVFLFRDWENWSSCAISIETPDIYLDYDRVEVDGEALNNAEFNEFLSRYREAANQTYSSVACELSASPGVSYNLFMDHITTMSESGFNVAILKGSEHSANISR